jgi:hypothetical protein
MRCLRRVVVVGFVVGSGGVVVLGILTLGVVLLNPFAGFDGRIEFARLSGRTAKDRLEDTWPSGVDPGAVTEVSFKTEWSRDSYSSWFQIRLLPTAAARWQDDIHSKQQSSSIDCLHHLHEGAEGVHHVVSAPRIAIAHTGAAPVWWTPPAMNFRATEAMLWYTNYDSGVARATYSGLDPSTNTLWIYEFACQHGRLWAPGDIPKGEQFAAVGHKDLAPPSSGSPN